MSDQRAGSASVSRPPARGRAAVAASMLAVLLIGGYVAAAPDTASAMSAEFAVNAVILVLVFWFPAARVGSPADVLAAWKKLIPWLLAWTLVWDLATSGIVGRRALLQDWWLVYPTGVATFFVLLLFHGLVVRRVGAEEGDG